MRSTVDIPQGYSVFKTLGGKWRWESILAPESHSSGGFASYKDAAEHCHMSNNLEYDVDPTYDEEEAENYQFERSMTGHLAITKMQAGSTNAIFERLTGLIEQKSRGVHFLPRQVIKRAMRDLKSSGSQANG
jgi:type IV secretory pathway ATPase VirB11/archaellum biosynthesis ATPase